MLKTLSKLITNDLISAIIVSIIFSNAAYGLTLSGTVRDSQTLLPISGAKVQYLDKGTSATTNARGEFNLAINPASSKSAANSAANIIVSADKYWQRQMPITDFSSSGTHIDLQAEKQRLIITTDIGGEDPDDLQSLVHALLLSNEYDLEGIIFGHTWVATDLNKGRDRIHTALDAYEKVYANLKTHDSTYPTPKYLKSIVKTGQAQARLEGVGKNKDSEGANLIVKAVSNKSDPRPIWVNVWGGANTVAQAYWMVKNSGSKKELEYFVNKLRVYDVLGQDDAGSWIAKTFPNSFYIRNADGIYGWAPSKEWTTENVQSHGELGKVYPTAKWATEGDSPAFLHLASRGLNNPDELSQGGWGGRFGETKLSGIKLFSWAEKNANVAAQDKKLRPYFLYTNSNEGVEAIKKWQPDINNSLAARMDWTINPKYNTANHFPVAAINGDRTKQILQINSKSNQLVELDAAGSSDPDNDHLNYSWEFYREASTYNGQVKISGKNLPKASIAIPANATGKNMHIILKLSDAGSPSLTSYRRVILNIDD